MAAPLDWTFARIAAKLVKKLDNTNAAPKKTSSEEVEDPLSRNSQVKMSCSSIQDVEQQLGLLLTSIEMMIGEKFFGVKFVRCFAFGGNKNICKMLGIENVVWTQRLSMAAQPYIMTAKKMQHLALLEIVSAFLKVVPTAGSLESLYNLLVDNIRKS
jgi:hypothetical protein